MAQKKEHIALPPELVSSVDLARLERELAALDDSIHQTSLRKAGQPTKLARSSITLENLARLNGVSLTDKEHRQQLLTLMKALSEHSPRMHISVANEPSGNFTKNLITWLRKNIHPTVLLEIGLQPALSAGCTIRTPNKFFDMSLRHRFYENRPLLMEKIKEMDKAA